MADTMCSLPLQQLLATIDTRRLPLILEFRSGIYVQGSVYELSGNEVCFSTGDMVKVIGLTLESITCEDATSNQKSEMQISSKGLFKQAEKNRCFQTLKAMLDVRTQEKGDSCLPFSFISHSELTLDALVVGPGTVMVAISVEPCQRQGKERMLCQMRGSWGGSLGVALPLCCRGQFSECFTAQEIVSSSRLCRGRFCCVETADGVERPLVFWPVYNVEARMHLRKDTVTFSSNLEVDVVEVTDHDTSFIVPLTLDELLTMPDHTFPVVAQILAMPKLEHLVRSGWVEELRSQQTLVLHGTGAITMALCSSARRAKRQYFLVSEGYAGMFRRRPREFLSVFELYVAATQQPGLKVTVTRSGQEAADDMIGLVAGEVLEVVGFHVGGQGAQLQNAKQEGDVVICRRIEESSDDEQEEEGVSSSSATVVLPLHWHGFFTEVISNNKKYKIRDMCQKFSLPLNVKVVSRDSTLAFDPLYGISSFCLECITTETIIWASILTSPELCFTIPTRCLSMDIQFTQQSLPWPKDEPPACLTDTVIEVTESFYLEDCRLIYSQQPPPPRPPKTTNLSLAPKPCNPETLALSVPRKPAIPSPTPSHHSVNRLQHANQQGEVQSEDSDHDYESGDLMDAIKKMQEFTIS